MSLIVLVRSGQNLTTLILQLRSKNILNSYFKIFPWELIDKNKSVGIDIGCGSGRWANFISEKTNKLILLDASSTALEVAKKI